jgi:hypothetical protein
VGALAKSRKSVSKEKIISEAADAVSDIATEADQASKPEENSETIARDAEILEGADASPAAAEEPKIDLEDEPRTAAPDDMQGEVEVSQETRDTAADAEDAGKDAVEHNRTPDEDVTEKAEAETMTASPMVLVPAPRPEPQRSVFWPLVFGGIVAGALGFIAGRSDVLEAYLPASMQRGESDLAEIEALVASQTSTIAATAEAQAARIAALEQRPDPADPGAALAALTDRLATFEVQIADLEARPVQVETGQSEAAVAEIDALRQSLAAQEASLAEQQAALEAQRAEIAELSARTDAAADAARSEAENILARAALTRVVSAVETGEAFTPALGDLEEITALEIPEALRQAAAEGVPTLNTLQAEFPDAARAALAAARAAVPESEVEGLGGFLRRQLGARSLTPREGSDPDAVLSRAEAALRQGDLDSALEEMNALPDVAKTAMQAWLDAATARQSAEKAASALADSLQSN